MPISRSFPNSNPLDHAMIADTHSKCGEVNFTCYKQARRADPGGSDNKCVRNQPEASDSSSLPLCFYMSPFARRHSASSSFFFYFDDLIVFNKKTAGGSVNRWWWWWLQCYYLSALSWLHSCLSCALNVVILSLLMLLWTLTFPTSSGISPR